MSPKSLHHIYICIMMVICTSDMAFAPKEHKRQSQSRLEGPQARIYNIDFQNLNNNNKYSLSSTPRIDKHSEILIYATPSLLIEKPIWLPKVISILLIFVTFHVSRPLQKSCTDVKIATQQNKTSMICNYKRMLTLISKMLDIKSLTAGYPACSQSGERPLFRCASIF